MEIESALTLAKRLCETMSSLADPPEQSPLDSTSESTADLISEVCPAEGTLPPTLAEEQSAKLRPIYFVSGLGADERVFRWLRCEGYRPVHVQWLSPEPNEPIADYAKRLASQIQEEKPTVIGLSFGGIVAVEIAKQIETEQVILLSSVKASSEIPFYFKLFRVFPIHRIFPFKSLLWAFYWLFYWLFAPEGSDQKQLLRTILIETDPQFLKWALHKVVTWKNQEVPDNLVHIHGKGDRIFPYRFVAPNYSVENSGHLMVMNRAEQVSDLIEQLVIRA